MKPTYKQELAADFFNALAHPRRQMLFQILRAAGPKGMPFHRLIAQSGLNRTTLAFHISKMTRGHLVRRRIKGPETWLTVNPAAFDRYALALVVQ